MTLTIQPQEFALLRRHIESLCGISLGDDKAYLVESRLSSLVQQAGCSSFGEFYRKLQSGSRVNGLREAVLDAIVTNETLWFRDRQPFRILENTLLPMLKQEIDAGQRDRIAIWSAACATGQEPYSIAMTVRDFFVRCGFESECARMVCITATDVSRTSLDKAKQGTYSDTVMRRGMMPGYMHRYFEKHDDQWHIDSRIRDMVSFQQYNLKETPHPTLGSFDVVFLRNAIIYFSDPFKRELFEKTARLMRPRGHLFLGTGETISGYTDTFEMVEDPDGVYYRVRR